jgi:hypothetical protein
VSEYEATIECLRCGTEFDGPPEEQVTLFRLHDCDMMRELQHIEIEHARRRHPTGRQRHRQLRHNSNAVAMLIALAVVGALAVANWLVETLARLSLTAPIIIGAVFFTLFAVVFHQLVKLGEES